MSGEYTLDVLLRAQNQAAAPIAGFVGSLLNIGPALSRIGNGAGNVAFGLKNMGTAGTVGTDALKAGAGDAALGLASLGVSATIVGGLAAAAIGVVAVKSAADFQQGLNRLVTGAGDVTDNMNLMGQSILRTSSSSGIMTGDLLPAMYQIISAGQRGATAQDTLSVAARGSVVEQAKVVDVANALSTAMTDYGTKQYNATQFMNGYTVATQRGKLTLEELSNSMGPILPLANNVGIGFADVAGAMSTMTNAGVPADRAATSMRFLMQSLENPTKKATDAMRSMGLNSVDVGNEMKVSLPGALQMIYNAAKKAGPEGSVPFNRALSDMIGGQRSLQAGLSLTGSHLKTFKDNVNGIKGAMDGSKTSLQGWQVAQGNLNTSLSQVKTSAMALLITIGQQLLPVVSSIVSKIAPVIAKFAEWVIKSHVIEDATKTLKTILDPMFDVIAAVLPVVVGIFFGFLGVLKSVMEWAAKNKSVIDALILVFKIIGVIIVAVVAAALLLLIIGFAAVAIAIAAVIAIVWLLTQAWNAGVAAVNWLVGAVKAAVAWIGGAFNTLVGAVTAAFNAVKNAIVSVWNSIVSTIKNVVNGIVNWLVTAWQNCVNAVAGAFQWLYNHNYYFKMLVDFIRNVVQSVISWLTTAWGNVVSWISDKWQWLSNQATSIWNAVTSFIQGAVQKASDIIKSVWDAIASFLSGVWNTITSATQSAWNTIVGFFQNAWGRISGPLSSLGSSIGNFFGGLANAAFQWGANVIQGVVNGINSMLGAVGNAAGNVAKTITGFLGFHSPTKEGPGQYADEWAPNLMKMYASGIVGGAPALAQAAANAVMLMSAGFKGDALQLNSLLNKQGSSTMGMFANKAGMMGDDYYGGIAPGGTQLGTIHNTTITITANDAADVAQKVKAIQDKQYRMSGTHSVVSSGGKR